MHGPTGIFWTNLTPFSLQRSALMAGDAGGVSTGAVKAEAASARVRHQLAAEVGACSLARICWCWLVLVLQSCLQALPVFLHLVVVGQL